MKKKILFALLFLFVAININAQKTDLIVGKWIFKEAFNKDIDEEGLAFMKAEVIDKWKFVFNSNGKFETYMMGEEAIGKWKLNSDSSSIILLGIEGGPTEMKILKLSENELALKLGLGEFLLKRMKG